MSAYFRSFKDSWETDESSELRFALSQGFFMNTCRKVSHMQKKDGGQVYLSVADGTFVKSDRDGSTYAGADYVIYTQLQGTGMTASGSGSLGVMKMASAINV